MQQGLNVMLVMCYCYEENFGVGVRYKDMKWRLKKGSSCVSGIQVCGLQTNVTNGSVAFYKLLIIWLAL